MQEIQGVDEKYRIDTQQVVVPQEAQLKASGKLRMLVVVFALGAILLFIAITLIDAIKALRGERPPFENPGRRYLPPGPTPNGGAPALPERASATELAEHQPRREVTLWIPDNPAQLPASNGHASAENGHASGEDRQLVETIAAPTTNGTVPRTATATRRTGRLRTRPTKPPVSRWTGSAEPPAASGRRRAGRSMSDRGAPAG